MGIVSILLGVIMLVACVGCGFFVFNILDSMHLFSAVPNGFGEGVDPGVLIVGIFALIGLVIFLNFLMSGIALIRVRKLNNRLERIRRHKRDAE